MSQINICTAIKVKPWDRTPLDRFEGVAIKLQVTTVDICNYKGGLEKYMKLKKRKISRMHKSQKITSNTWSVVVLSTQCHGPVNIWQSPMDHSGFARDHNVNKFLFLFNRSIHKITVTLLHTYGATFMEIMINFKK